MATVLESIQASLTGLKLSYSDVKLSNLLVKAQLDGSESYSLENSALVDWVIVYSIADILATPDISEDSFSVKYDREALIKYCAFLSASAGFDNPFEVKEDNTIRNFSRYY